MYPCPGPQLPSNMLFPHVSSTRLEAIAIRMEAFALRVEAIAIWVEAIALRVEAIKCIAIRSKGTRKGKDPL